MGVLLIDGVAQAFGDFGGAIGWHLDLVDGPLIDPRCVV
jgi:hypothetical protein